MMPQGLVFLCIAAFAAGFIDAIVGGGGLIQTPALLIALPKYPVATLLGTTKIPSFLGTSMAAVQYTKIVKLRWKLLTLMCCLALIAAYAGSKTVSVVSNTFMKPVIFGMLIIVAFYTWSKKDFGIASVRSHPPRREQLYAALFAVILGFYDGFIGPGAGSFLVLFFIGVLGFDFLKASAHAKFVNLSTNMGSIIFFGGSGHILFQYAIPMAACNFIGSMLGARLAILKGNTFIRIFFLIIVVGTIIRFGYDIFFKR
jgi:uncharacterized membrane protein YfcA